MNPEKRPSPITFREQTGTADSITLPALSLWQPWASAIASGKKQNETRGWKRDYRGPIAILATASIHADAREFVRARLAEIRCDERDGDITDAAMRRDSLTYPGINDGQPIDEKTIGKMPLACVVAIARVVETIYVPMLTRYQEEIVTARFYNGRGEIEERIVPPPQISLERMLGNYWDGERYAWCLTDIMPTPENPKARGGQGLFNLDPDVAKPLLSKYRRFCAALRPQCRICARHVGAVYSADEDYWKYIREIGWQHRCGMGESSRWVPFGEVACEANTPEEITEEQREALLARSEAFRPDFSSMTATLFEGEKTR